jgi:hypothetical protein
MGRYVVRRILQAIPLLLAPVLSKLLSQVNPRWLLVGGLLPMAAGQFWVAALPITTTSLAAYIGPVLLLGVGFICVVSSLTAAAVNAVPIKLTGMASGATSLVREFGQALGPAVISAVAMGIASGHLAGKLTGPGAAVNEQGGPLAVVNVPQVGEAAQLAARDALASGLSTGMVVCGCASLAGALVTLLLVRKSADRKSTVGEPAVESATA